MLATLLNPNNAQLANSQRAKGWRVVRKSARTWRVFQPAKNLLRFS